MFVFSRFARRKACARTAQLGRRARSAPTVHQRWDVFGAAGAARRGAARAGAGAVRERIARVGRRGDGQASSPRGIVNSTGSGSVFTRTLRQGNRGADVKTLQTWLTDVGDAVPETGYFGSMTKAAVIDFQTAMSLAPATGVVGRQTAAALLAAGQADGQGLRRGRHAGAVARGHDRLGVPADADLAGASVERLDARPGRSTSARSTTPAAARWSRWR